MRRQSLHPQVEGRQYNVTYRIIWHDADFAGYYNGTVQDETYGWTWWPDNDEHRRVWMGDAWCLPPKD